MTWYFVSAGAQAGPVSDIQLEEFIQAGKILPETLIWREGMENWQPCGEVKPAAPFKLLAATPKPPSAAKRDTTVAEIVCAECGGLHPKENAIKHGEAWICATCKPVHFQKLKEGVTARSAGTGAVEYAGVGARALAKLLDVLIFGFTGALLIAIATAALAPMMGPRGQSPNGSVLLIWLGVIAVVVLAIMIYQIWCLPKYGGTPGKRILGLRVVTADGGEISWGRAIGRFFGEWVNGLIPFWIGYIIAAFDPERRTVHDHIAGTRVIKV